MYVKLPLLRLRSIMLIVTLVVLTLPLGSIFFFRIYENALVQQTETELIAQATILSSLYKQQVRQSLKDGQAYGTMLPNYAPTLIDDKYTPVFAQIDLAENATLPERPDAMAATTASDAIALRAGAALLPIMEDAKRTTLSGMMLLDYRGTVIAGNAHHGRSFAHISEVQHALEGRYSSVVRDRTTSSATPALASISRGTGIRVFIAYPIMQGQECWGVLYLSRTPKNILKHLHAEKEKVVFGGLTILGLTFLLALFTSATITRPIDRLVKMIHAARDNPQHHITPLTSPRTVEVAHLSQSFASLAEELQQRSDYIRNFATHLSHEFKTPLTSISGACELLQEHLGDMEEDKQRQFLTNITQDTQRLGRLVARLLELAKADSMTPSPAQTTLQHVMTRIHSRYHRSGLEIQATENNTTLSISAEALETTLINLCDNALQHGASSVIIHAEPTDTHMHIHITDNGQGISPANQADIFTPFFTTRRDDGGTGLGLGIVRTMLEAYGGSIDVVAHEGGACFEVRVSL